MSDLVGNPIDRFSCDAAHIIFLIVSAKEDNDMKEIAIDATTRLKQAVTNEREVKLRLKEENEQLKVIG